MPDQAYDLRRLATRGDRVGSRRCADRPKLLVVAGGKGGVGTTTVALNLASALAKTGKHALLIDADPRGGDAAVICGIEGRCTLANVLAGRQSWSEATHIGPDGVHLIVGQRGWHEVGSPAAAAARLLERLGDQDLAADTVVLDIGNQIVGIASYLCREADAVLLVTTSDAASVVDTFAAIRALGSASWGSDSQARLYLLVNMAAANRVAETVHYRLARTCRRMLGIELQSGGHLSSIGLSRKNRGSATIGLNLQLSLADTLRRVFAADVVLSWKRHARIDGTTACQSLKQ
jgi:flagellar biosynthesis protein FlhG